MAGFAALLHDLGDDAAAEDLYRQALFGLGALHLGRGDAAAAEPLLREALAIRQRALPDGHWHVAQAASALGASLSILGRFEEAEPLLLDGYGTLREVRGDDDVATRRARQHVIVHYGRAGRPGP